MMNMNPMQMMQQFQQFRQSMTGNPQQILQQMMNSGRYNQQMLNQAQAMAKQYGPMFFGNKQ